MRTDLLARVGAALETGRGQRPFGSGWLSGSIGLLAGIVALLLVVALRNPSRFTTPELAILREAAAFRPALSFILVAGYLLAGLSLAVRSDETLGVAAMTVTLLASLIGGLPPRPTLPLRPRLGRRRKRLGPISARSRPRSAIGAKTVRKPTAEAMTRILPRQGTSLKALWKAVSHARRPLV